MQEIIKYFRFLFRVPSVFTFSLKSQKQICGLKNCTPYKIYGSSVISKLYEDGTHNAVFHYIGNEKVLDLSFWKKPSYSSLSFKQNQHYFNFKIEQCAIFIQKKKSIYLFSIFKIINPNNKEKVNKISLDSTWRKEKR